MKIKGVMNDNPFTVEEIVVMAIYRLCDVFMRGNPQITEEDAAVIATNDNGTILFRGTADEMLLFKEALRLVVKRYERIQKIGNGSPSGHLVRIEMENAKDDIADAMEFKKQCSPKSSLSEAFHQMAHCS